MAKRWDEPGTRGNFGRLRADGGKDKLWNELNAPADQRDVSFL
jgi:hypothetical protein